MHDLVKFAIVPALIGAAVGLGVVFFSAGDVDAPARPGFAGAVARAAPAVVNIYSTKLLKPAICEQPRFRDWCERFAGEGRLHMQSSLGSGVIVHPEGYILTNNHVIDGADEILVGFADGTTTSASLVGSDPETDLAVIRAPATGLTPITVGLSGQVAVGDVALAIGNPFGIGQTVSAGIVSAKGRAGISASPYDDFIQTDAAINPGNSGGPLIDADGALIGINTMIFSRSGGSEGVGFAIPAQLAYAVLEEIIQNGRVIRGWIGVELTNTPAAGSAVGLKVTAVERGGPAELAGIRSGDLILAVNDHPAVSSTDVSRAIAATVPGKHVSIEVLRGDRQLTFAATAGERP